MKRISVCIPSYNGARHLGQTIRSVLASSDLDLEVIVNDDASHDGTRDVVESFEDDRILFFQNRHRLGVPANWNRAIERASGKYIGLLNHDDLYGVFWLDFAVYHLDRRPEVGWTSTACRKVDSEGRTVRFGSRFPETREYFPEEAFPSVANYGALLPVFLARREALEEVGPYCEAAGPYADHDLHLRLASRFPLYYSANPLMAAWRFHDTNLTHQVQSQELGIRALCSLEILDRVLAGDGFPEDLLRLGHECRHEICSLLVARCRALEERGRIASFPELERWMLISRGAGS